MKTSDKRIHFVALMVNKGVDAKKANSWYCNLPKNKSKNISNESLVKLCNI